jgi:hypothetical protein
MKRIALVAAMLLLSACGQKQNPGSQVDLSHVRLACPKLERTSGYLVDAKVGLDAAMCKLSPIQNDLLPATFEIGNFPSPEPNLQFVGFTPSRVGQLAWFSIQKREPSQTARWVTYIPTGSKFPRVIKLVVMGGGVPDFLEQQARVADIVINADMESDR